MSKQRKERAMPEVVKLAQAQPKPVEPATSSSWWAKTDELQARLRGVTAMRAKLEGLRGDAVLAGAEAQLADIGLRIDVCRSLEEEITAALPVAELRRDVALQEEGQARRAELRARAAAIGAERRELAGMVDGLLMGLETALALYRDAGRIQGHLLQQVNCMPAMGGVSPMSDGSAVKDAVCKLSPSLAETLGLDGFDHSLSMAELKPLAATELQRQGNVLSRLQQGAAREVELEDAA